MLQQISSVPVEVAAVSPLSTIGLPTIAGKPLHQRIGYEMTIEVNAPTPIVLLMNVHPERAADVIAGSDEVRFDAVAPAIDLQAVQVVVPPAPVKGRVSIDGFGNRCVRAVLPPGRTRVWADSIIADSAEPEPFDLNAKQTPTDALPDEALPFLLPSRYCEVERLGGAAWQLFGKIAPGAARAAAVCEWTFKNIEFGYKHARQTKTAWDTFVERKGVCRDFMHLAIALTRCLNVPARYATGYLGDIGAPPDPTPMDFSAYYEVYLDGKWWAMDARHNARRIGRVLQARGRDAADVALLTTFGPHALRGFKVWTDEITAASTSMSSLQQRAA